MMLVGLSSWWNVGIDEFPMVTENDIRLALKTLKEKGENGVFMYAS